MILSGVTGDEFSLAADLVVIQGVNAMLPMRNTEAACRGQFEDTLLCKEMCADCSDPL